jgi:hypothetical protein
MADWWMLSGTTSTETGAGGPVMVGQSAEVTAVQIASCAVQTAELGALSVTSAKLGALSVTSEKASANLQRRSVSVTVGSTSGAGFASTSLALFTAPVPITVTAIRVTPLTAWSLATCGENVIFWSCVSGEISSYCTSSTGFCKTVGDVHSCFTLNATGVTLAACETVRLKVGVVGTTSCAQVANVQIDYVTSG